MRTLRRATALKALWSALTRAGATSGHGLGEQLRAVPRMLRAALTGRYPGLDRRRLAVMALAAVYVVSPVDLVPGAVFLLLGVADDALVVTWLAGALLSEVDAFLDWEAARAGPAGRTAADQPDVVVGEVVR